MITLEAIRKAIRSSEPYEEMDRLVRKELDAGQKVVDVFEAINPFVDSVLDTPGLSEDGEEAFLGALDALTGGCHPDSCYKDRPMEQPANEPVR